ncbi:hypothetical protein CDL15_Pgr009247 [Punica granatum]|nr:hypothetical protein CDL15_Pgr009247 [Punica granatum]PKI41436.1 hypothetical protein CRG98_038174 [Punica granatum]
MEKTVLGKIKWYLTIPTSYVFLLRFIKAALVDRILENMVYFLSKLGLMNYSTISHPPSMVAASAVYAACCTLNISPFWSATLNVHTGNTEAQIMDCAKLLVTFHANAKDGKFQVVYRKYSSSQRAAVALLSPAKALLDDDSGDTEGPHRLHQGTDHVSKTKSPNPANAKNSKFQVVYRKYSSSPRR